MKITWNRNASKSHLEILDFLIFKWNYEIAENFNDLILQAERQIIKFPDSGTPFSKTIRKIILHKNASLYYEYDENLKTITILLFIDNRQNPDAYFKLL